MRNLTGKTAIVIGASGGIGSEIAKILDVNGVELVLCARDKTNLSKLQTTLKKPCKLLAVDIATADGRSQLVDYCSENNINIDYLINCVGVNQFDVLESFSDEQIAKLINVNLVSHIALIKALLPKLKQQQKAEIITIGSTLGSIGLPGYSVYCASKFGLRGFTEALSRELKDTAIRVRYFAPRATQTAINDESIVSLNHELGSVMDAPEKVAQSFFHFLTSNRLRYFLGWPEKLFVLINAVLPNVVDKAIYKQLPIYKKYLTRREQ